MTSFVHKGAQRTTQDHKGHFNQHILNFKLKKIKFKKKKPCELIVIKLLILNDKFVTTYNDVE